MKVIFYLAIALLFVLSACSHINQKSDFYSHGNNTIKKLVSTTWDAGWGGGVDLVK